MKKIRQQVITNKHTTKILIPLLLLSLTLLFCFGAVSAADGDVIYVNGSGSDSNDGFTPGTAKASIGNATWAVNTGGTINVANGTYNGVKDTGITITRNMTIIGESRTGIIIDSPSMYRIFKINSGVTVTLKNLTLKNGNINNGGVAIYNEGNLTVENCTFTNNNANNGGGGAILNWGTLTLTGSTFTGNRANRGGALYNYQGTMTVTDSIFTNNVANYGGALYNYQGTMTVIGSAFKDNNANNGGAIEIDGGNLTVNNSTFTENSANYDGGAIYNIGNLDIASSTFTRNTVNYSGYSGGAIYSNVGTVTINESTFNENTATSGGAIVNGDTLNVTNSTFTDNTANGDGGAIYNSGNLTVENCTSTNNTASFYGGAILNKGYDTLTVNNSTFTGNTAGQDGGAIENWGTLTIIGSTFNGNTANGTDFGGGAIDNYMGTLTVTGSTFIGNRAPNGRGGAILNWDGTSTVHFNRFYNNTANQGGAIYNTAYGSVNAENNWWGSNNPYFPSLISGNVDYSPWIMLRISADPGSIHYLGTSNITADLTWNTEDGVTPLEQPSGGHIPDGIIVAFGVQTGPGSVDPTGSLTNTGTSESTYTGTGVGTATIYTQVDGETQYINVIVNKANTTITVNSASGVYKGNTDLTATLIDEHGNPIVNVTVEFYVNGTLIGTSNTDGNGIASVTYTILLNPTGSPYTITATFAGNDYYNADNANNQLTINKANSTLIVNPSSGIYKGSTNLTATLVDEHGDAIVGETIKFYINGTLIGTNTTDASGYTSVTYNPILLTPGNYTIEAIFSGNDYYNTDNDNNQLTINKANTTVTVNAVSGYAGQNVTLKANVTGSNVNEGQVRFTVSNVVAGTVNVVNGLATLVWKIPSTWKGKNYTITAKYLGTTNYTTSNNTNTLTVKPTANLAFTKTVSKGTHYYGDTIYYYLTVKNNGPDSATGVSIYDKLPAGLKYLSSSATKGSYKLSTSIWTIGTLQAGQTAKLNIKVLIEKVGTIKNTAKLSYTTYPKTSTTKSVSFNVPAAVPIAELIKASNQIKKYYETHNNRLPATLKVAGQTLTMPQLLKLLTTATINISKKNMKPISVTAVRNAPYPGGNYRSGQVYNYLSVAKDIQRFINNKGRAPNYAVTTLGNIPFSKLVYMYSKVVNFYGQKNRLPNYVATYKI